MARWLGIVGLVLGVSLATVTAAAASMASIVTVAPVAEGESEEGLKAAAASALRRAVRGARAMGMDDVTLKSIRLVPGTGVVVEIVASESGSEPDSDLEAPEPEGPGPRRSSL